SVLLIVKEEKKIMNSFGQMKRYGIAIIVIVVVLAGIATYMYTRGGEGPVENEQGEHPGWYGGDELVVWEWGGYDYENYYRGFTKKHPDVEVKFKIYGSISEAVSKLAAGGRFDVSHMGVTYPRFLDRYYAQDSVAPIKTEWISRYENLYDFFKTNYVEDEHFRWNGKPYMIPTDWGTTSLIYNREMFEEAGLEPPNSWSALWDPKYTETVGVAMWTAPGEITQGIMAALGYSLEEYKHPTEEMLDEYENAVQKSFERMSTSYTSGYKSYSILGKEEAGIAMCWDEAYAYGIQGGVPLGYVGITPGTGFREGEGYITWVSGLAIGKRTMTNGRYKLAHDFIDAWISAEYDPETGAEGGLANLNRYYYASTNKNVAKSPYANQEIVEMMNLDNPIEKLETGLPVRSFLDATVWDKYTDRWIRAKTKAGL
ncbi:hypothetical protein AKJ49_02265, partial [candidate division MSBL1 archaeon SCGC-AAA382A03]